MADIGVAPFKQQGLDGQQGGVQLAGRLYVELFDRLGGFAHNVVAGTIIDVEREQSGSVVKVGTTYDPNLFKNRHAAINRHQVATPATKILADNLNARGLPQLYHGGQNRQARPRDPQACSLEPGGDDNHRLVSVTGNRCVGLGGSDHEAP